MLSSIWHYYLGSNRLSLIFDDVMRVLCSLQKTGSVWFHRLHKLQELNISILEHNCAGHWRLFFMEPVCDAAVSHLRYL